jgi:succinoglycan biosynthesis transport protein ExoP
MNSDIVPAGPNRPALYRSEERRVEKKREVTVEEMFRVMRRRLSGVMALVCGSVLVAILFYYLQPPEYHAVSVVMIKEDKRPGDLLQGFLGPEASLDINAAKKDIALISSMPVAELTVSKLQRSPEGNALELFGSRTYQSPVTAFLASFIPPDVLNASPAERQTMSDEELLRRRAVLLTKRIRVQPVKDTNMLRVSVRSPFADEAELLTNTLCGAYREADIARYSEKYAHANRFIAKSLVDQKDKVADADRALSGFMTRNEIYEVSGNTKQLLERLVEAEARYNAINAEYNTVGNTLRFLDQKLSESDKAIGSQIEQTVSSKLGFIMEEIRSLESGYVSQLREKGADDPEVKAAKDRLEGVKSRYETLQRSQIAGEIGYAGRAKKFGFDMVSEKLQIERKLNELKFRAGEFAQIRQYYEDHLATLPQKQQEYLKLERDRNVASKTYEELKQKFDETSIFLGSEVGGVSLIGNAFRPFTPESPSLLRNLLFGLLFGGLLSIGYIYLKEALDNTLQDDALFDEIGIRPLSVIPTVGPSGYPSLSGNGSIRSLDQAGRSIRKLLPGSRQKQDASEVQVVDPALPLITDNLTAPFAESIRTLRTSIQYASRGTPPQMMLISGTAMWEGKSTVCLNLGMAYALIGKRTLIIDCDLRRPSQHLKLQCKKGPGLTDFLTGATDETSLPNVQSTRMENLFLLSAGKSIPGSSELLASQEMRDLLMLMRRSYDFVLLDCPPFFLSDAAQLADATDGIVLVSRLQHTDRKMLRNIVSDPSLADHLIGIALITTPEMSGAGYQGRYGNGEYDEYAQIIS